MSMPEAMSAWSNREIDGGQPRPDHGRRQRSFDCLGHRQGGCATGADLAFTYQGEALGKRVGPLAEIARLRPVLPCDVEDLASVEERFAEIEKQWGGLDFLVHAIGFSDKNELQGPLRRYDPRKFLRARC